MLVYELIFRTISSEINPLEAVEKLMRGKRKEKEGEREEEKKGLLSPLSKPRRQQRLFNDKDKQKRILFLMTELERGNSLNHFSFLLAPFSLLLINLIVQRIPFSFFPRIINLQQQLNCP